MCSIRNRKMMDTGTPVLGRGLKEKFSEESVDKFTTS